MIGPDVNQSRLPGRLQQREMQVGAVHDRVGIAVALAEGGVERDMDDLLAGEPVHQPQPVDINRLRASAIADAQSVEAVKRVRRDLNASADLSEFGRLLQNDSRNVLSSQRKGRGHAADAAAGHNQPIHPILPSISRHFAPHADQFEPPPRPEVAALQPISCLAPVFDDNSTASRSL